MPPWDRNGSLSHFGDQTHGKNPARTSTRWRALQREGVYTNSNPRRIFGDTSTNRYVIGFLPIDGVDIRHYSTNPVNANCALLGTLLWTFWGKVQSRAEIVSSERLLISRLRNIPGENDRKPNFDTHSMMKNWASYVLNTVLSRCHEGLEVWRKPVSAVRFDHD